MRRGPDSPRPRLTLRIALFGLVDVAGMTMVALGAAFIAYARPVLLSGFPSTRAQAWGCIILGIALMIWSVAQIIKEILKQSE